MDLAKALWRHASAPWAQLEPLTKLCFTLTTLQLSWCFKTWLPVIWSFVLNRKKRFSVLSKCSNISRQSKTISPGQSKTISTVAFAVHQAPRWRRPLADRGAACQYSKRTSFSDSRHNNNGLNYGRWIIPHIEKSLSGVYWYKRENNIDHGVLVPGADCIFAIFIL